LEQLALSPARSEERSHNDTFINWAHLRFLRFSSIKDEDFCDPKTLVSRATAYAAKKWEQLSHADSSSWKHKLYVNGQKLLDKMDYEEYFLKGVPLKKEINDASSKVPLLYPSKTVKPEKVTETLERLLKSRIPYHRKYMIYSGLLLPLSASFTIVPLVPNIPLFYNLFRFYSHYKAFKGAQHLQHITNDGRLIPTKSDQLNYIFDGLDLENGDVIDEDRIHMITDEFKVERLGIEVRRARHQILEKLKTESPDKYKWVKQKNGYSDSYERKGGVEDIVRSRSREDNLKELHIADNTKIKGDIDGHKEGRKVKNVKIITDTIVNRKDESKTINNNIVK
ncbi:9243_t:CDS:2, partial [Acaulospora morrowiae]